MRSNPNATSGSGACSVAAQMDARHWTAFGAAWTLGSIAALASGGADSATYFATFGPLGLLDPATGRTAPALQVFADLGATREVTITWLTATVVHLALADEHVCLLANLGAQPATVALHGRLRVIDHEHPYAAERWAQQGCVVAGPTVLAAASYARLDQWLSA
jgi:hypothetical protein